MKSKETQKVSFAFYPKFNMLIKKIHKINSPNKIYKKKKILILIEAGALVVNYLLAASSNL